MTKAAMVANSDGLNSPVSHRPTGGGRPVYPASPVIQHLAPPLYARSPYALLPLGGSMSRKIGLMARVPPAL